MSLSRIALAALAALALSPAGALAVPITPIFDTFGPLPEATWGGSGIPNDRVAITTISDGGNTITLAMSSHGRFSNTLIGDDGAGTFFARPGQNTPAGTTIAGATWNFNFFMEIEGGGSFADYDVDLLYDFDPGLATDESDHGRIDIDASLPDPAAFTLVESSQNLLFGFLGTAIPGVLTPPPGSFDPEAAGEYSFALSASNTSGELGRAAIRVEVVPAPAPLALVAAGLLGMGAARARRSRA